MSTTIDSLEIKIQSDSAKAADGIEELAIALGDLKTNGAIGTAVKNLNNLSDALKKLTPVTSNANKLSALAKSIQELSAVGSINKVVNQLNKLPGALKGLSSLNIDNNLGAKLNSLAQAVQPLSRVKSGGFGTMVNSLSKIGEVTKKLDDTAIKNFADRVQKLNTVLTPLSSKMTTIQAGLRGMNSTAKSAGVGVQRLGSKVNTTTLNLASLVTVIQGAVAALRPLVTMLGNTISAAIEWDGVSQRFGRGFGTGAEETYQWIQRLNEEMGINVQQFMQYSSVYATMLTGFGVAMEDAGKMALGYTELTYDIWAGYNDIYSSYADAADAVKSAIAGEVEPIRRAGFTIVESTLEQTAANHGLEISLEQATEAQKSYLRYLTLVDQAHAQNLVGTYARELNTAEGLMRTFSQQLKSLAQAFGSLFLPILVKVMPWLQAFVSLLTEAIIAVASFFGIEIQPVDWSGFSAGASGLGDVADSADTATGSLGDAADAAGSAAKAVEDLKRATIGIDELNVISPPKQNSGSGGSGGSGGGAGGIGGGAGFDGLDVDSLWDESIFKDIQDRVGEIKDKILGFFKEWETEIKIIGGLLGLLGMAKMLEHLGQALGLGDKFLGLMKTISKLAVTGIIITLQYTLMTEFFDKYIDGEGFKWYVASLFVGAIGTGILYSMWGPTGLVIGLAVTAAASLKAIIENGGINSTESAVVALTGLASAAGAVTIAWKKLGPAIMNSNFVQAIIGIANHSPAASSALTFMFQPVFKIYTAFSNAATAVAAFVGGLSAGALAGIVAAIAAVVSVVIFLKEHWDEVTAAVKRFFNENIAPKIEEIKGHFEKLKATLSPLLDLFGWLLKPIQDLIKGFKDWWAAAKPLEVLGDIFEVIGGVIFSVVSGVIAGAINTLVSMIENAVQVFSGVVQVVSGVVELVVALFTGGDIGKAWQKIWDGVVDVVSGLWDLVTKPISDFVNGIIDWFIDLWDELVGHSIVPDTIDGIVDCFLGLPGKVLNSVGKFVEDVIGKFSDFGSSILKKISSGWETVKSWFGGNNSKIDTKEVDVKLVKKGWTTVKDWIGKIPGVEQAVSLVKKSWSSVKKWVGDIPTLSQAISLVKKGWSSIKNWIGSIPALSQAIGLVKKGWKSVKSWVGSIPNVSQGVSLAKKGWSSVKKWVGNIPTLSAGIKLVKSGWSSVKKWLGDLNFKLGFKLPKIGVKWGSKEVLGFKISFPQSFYTYAKGGFPDLGEMFIAREAGPEMVGKIGNKTTVANNDQIVEAVSRGVYEAVMAAMKQSESSGSQSVNIFLDGKQITSAVERRQHERGASLMGREVYSY